jgi:hypothetical protein
MLVSQSPFKEQCGCADYITSAYPNQDPRLTTDYLLVERFGEEHQQDTQRAVVSFTLFHAHSSPLLLLSFIPHT